MLGLDLTLSLSRQAMMQSQRQRAARLSRDELIQVCHQQEHMIAELQRAAANLMVEHALGDAPAFGAPSDEHRQKARELMATNRGRREGWALRWARQVLGR